MSRPEYEDVYCLGCSGSGEGMYEGGRCWTCKGTGTERVLVSGDPEHEEEERDE